MVITLVLDPARLWRWHVTLIAALTEATGHQVAVAFSDTPEPLDRALGAILTLERTLTGQDTTPFDSLTPSEFARWSDTSIRPDLRIDLATPSLAAPVGAGRALTLVPLFDGNSGELVFWSGVLDGRAPRLDIAVIGTNFVSNIAIGQPAIQAPHAIIESASAVITRLITGLQRAAVDLPRHVPSSLTALAPVVPFSPRPNLSTKAAGAIARKVSAKARRLLDARLRTAPQWAVACHIASARAPAAPLSATLDLADYHLMPDDGERYYADPFIFARDGKTHVFVEELPYATGRGIISVATLAADGFMSVPRPVLETGHHLSYPQVFARDGAVWMLPEAAASGGLTLYRADPYPDRWTPVARLIDEPVHDATFFEHDGRLWIAANTQGGAGARWGSSWDALSLFSATTLMGPWQPHPANPLLIDAGATRSAGHIIQVGRDLWRPVQDCSRTYGGALGWARIQQLDTNTFRQDVEHRLSFSTTSNLIGPHTYNKWHTDTTTIEVIDVFATRRHLGARSRPATRL